MHHTTTITSVFAALAITGIASAEMIVNLGTVRQIAPRPTIEYSGNFGYAVSSYLDTSATRTVTSFDLNSIVLQIGGDLALTEIRVYDAGGNSYGTWSPGADIDMFRVTGAALEGNVVAGYSGVVTQHLGESAAILAARIAGLDSVSGDQHYNSEHFTSLGAGGRAWMHFDGFMHSDGSGSSGSSGPGSGSGGSGPGGFGGGGGSTTPIYGGLLIAAGMKLEIGEAGLGEKYGVELVFEPATVPAPGAIALLALAGFVARRRR
ncbi:MAG: hypothetical protein DWI10_01735 [Planctomycetota bacterium]|nr:MAG: hypothetical protein DWI10_01735 [Planctomycetota bacterium]